MKFLFDFRPCIGFSLFLGTSALTEGGYLYYFTKLSNRIPSGS
jgi:hypothetical protein